MADNYVLFSFTVALNSDETEEWARNSLDSNEDQGFDWDIDDGYVWISDGGCGDTDSVVSFLKGLVDHPGSELPYAGFTYATTCSRPRPFEFGGGAIMVHPDTSVDGITKALAPKVSYFDAYAWLANKEDDIDY